MDSRALIFHAKAIIRTRSGKPSQTALRRAISASYYSVFHSFLKAAADDLIGTSRRARNSVAYRQLYRAFEHSEIRRICELASKDQLPQKYAEALGSTRFHGSIKIVARNFVELQKSRHLADYDPQVRFTKSDALQAIELAVTATVVFDGGAPAEDRRNFLLCMLIRPR